MALGILAIIYVVIIIFTIAIQFLLYKNNGKSMNSIFIMNVALGIILAVIAYTSLPTNYTGQRILSITLGVLAILAVFVKLKNTNLLTSKIILSVSVIGGFIQLFI